MTEAAFPKGVALWPGWVTGRGFRIAEILAVAALYALMGWGGLMLAIPPGYASIAWPASGLAVAALIVRGAGLWPGVFLSAFVINCYAGNALDAGNIDWDAITVAAAIAAGSTVQALLAFALVAWRFPRPMRLDGFPDMLILCALCGPIASLVAPTIGVLALYLGGIIAPGELADNWFTWWTGDMLGILIVAPFILLGPWQNWAIFWKGAPLPKLRGEMIFVIALLIGATLVAWKITSDASYETNAESFEALAADSERALEHRIDMYAQSLEAGAGLLNASTNVTADEWRRFVDTLNIEQTLPGINGIGVILPVKQSDKAAWLESVKRQGVRDLTIHPETGRDDLFVITYIEPLEINREALGLDIAFEQNRRNAAIDARNTGESRITQRIFLVQDEDRTPGFLLLRPIYNRGVERSSIAARLSNFEGWVYAPFIANRFMRGLTASQGELLDIAVYDGARVDEDSLIYRVGKSADVSADFEIVKTLDVYGEQWTIRWSSTPLFVRSNANNEPILVLIGGLFISFLFVLLLLSYSRKQQDIQLKVEEKTRELVEREKGLTKALGALEESEKRFSALAGLSPVGIFRTDQHGFCTFVNEAWLTTIGLEAHEAMGAGWVKAIHPDDRQETYDKWLKSIGSKSTSRMDFRLKMPDGSIKWVELMSAPEIDDNGVVMSHIGVAIDYTERKRAEAAMAERDDRLAFYAQNTTDGIVYISFESGLVEISAATARMVGLKKEQLTLEELESFSHPDDRGLLEKEYQELKDGKKEQLLVTQRAKNQVTGEYLWVEMSGQLVYDRENDRASGMILSVRDVSERKKMEREIEIALEEAKAATKAKSAFLANMSHDLRTPMNGVLGFTELLLQEEPSPSQRRQLEMILQSSRAMMELLNDILDISKIEAGRMQIHKEPVNIAEKLTEWVSSLEPVAVKKNIEIKLKMLSTLPEMMCTDPLRLRQIVTNLIGNAVKFTDDGRVVVRAQRSGDEFILDVKDTGIGIAKEHQKTVFEQFVQADDQMDRKYGGSGLGLPISSELAELMNGSLTLASEVGKGTLLRLRIPLEEAEGEEHTDLLESAVEQAEPMPIHRQTLLVVEDNEINQELTIEMLSTLGYDAELAKNGEEAVKMVVKARDAGALYPLILMDLQMPRMDGYQATSEIRALGLGPEQLPIIAVSANAYSDDVAECLRCGMQSHLTKPVSVAHLGSAIKQWIRTEDDRRETAEAPEETDGATANQAKKPSAKQRLAAKFADRKGALVEAMEQAIVDAEPDASVWDALIDQIHQLAGTAGMFDEQALGEAMREIEHVLREATPEERPAILDRCYCELKADFGFGHADVVSAE